MYYLHSFLIDVSDNQNELIASQNSCLKHQLLGTGGSTLICPIGLVIIWFLLPCREEAKEHEDDETSEKTNPRKSLEEEYLETEKKVLLSHIVLTWFQSSSATFLNQLILCACVFTALNI